jgi:hypothetical protein
VVVGGYGGSGAATIESDAYVVVGEQQVGDERYHRHADDEREQQPRGMHHACS